MLKVFFLICFFDWTRNVLVKRVGFATITGPESRTMY